MAIGVNRLAGELVPLFFGLGLLASNLGALRLQLSKHRVIVRRCKEIGVLLGLAHLGCSQPLKLFQQYLIWL
jgi:hypothetical protein